MHKKIRNFTFFSFLFRSFVLFFFTIFFFIYVQFFIFLPNKMQAQFSRLFWFHFRFVTTNILPSRWTHITLPSLCMIHVGSISAGNRFWRVSRTVVAHCTWVGRGSWVVLTTGTVVPGLTVSRGGIESFLTTVLTRGTGRALVGGVQAFVGVKGTLRNVWNM